RNGNRAAAKRHEDAASHGASTAQGVRELPRQPHGGIKQSTVDPRTAQLLGEGDGPFSFGGNRLAAAPRTRWTVSYLPNYCRLDSRNGFGDCVLGRLRGRPRRTAGPPTPSKE